MSNQQQSDNDQFNESTDQQYIDQNFLKIINTLNNDNFSKIFLYLLENYSYNSSQNQINDFANILSSEIDYEIPFNNFYRQIKYLINKGIYLRLSKKFLTDLFILGLNEDKINIIKDLQKTNLDRLTELLNKSHIELNSYEIKNFNRIVDVEIKTEMPINTTNFRIYEDDSNFENEDINKQNILLNLKIAKKIKTENSMNPYNNSNEMGFFENINIKMNKLQLASFYSEIEKIQENLDKIC